jgi:monofunctional biosynthetic peptidoglycan transglycosylase
MFMLREKLEKKQAIQHLWLPIEEINARVPLALIAAEDQRFLEHHGFDFKAIKAAFEHNAAGKQIRGGSTISQQVAKNLFLSPNRSWLRKGLEAYLTFLIELLWDKRRIMEVYLNIVELGEGVYGVPSASQLYFKKSALALTASEAALIATALPNPLVYRLDSPSNYMHNRANWVQKQMGNLGGTAILTAWYQPKN